MEVAHASWIGNDQHHSDEPLHWDRAKSTDQEDALIRHLMQAGKVDSDGVRHSAKVAWRALAILQLEMEQDAAKPAEVDASCTDSFVGDGCVPKTSRH